MHLEIDLAKHSCIWEQKLKLNLQASPLELDAHSNWSGRRRRCYGGLHSVSKDWWWGRLICDCGVADCDHDSCRYCLGVQRGLQICRNISHGLCVLSAGHGLHNWGRDRENNWSNHHYWWWRCLNHQGRRIGGQLRSWGWCRSHGVCSSRGVLAAWQGPTLTYCWDFRMCCHTDGTAWQIKHSSLAGSSESTC